MFDIGVGDNPGAGHRVEDAGGVGAGIDGDDAGSLGRGGGVNAADAGVGVGAAQDGGVNQAGQLDVVGVGGLAGNQPGIFAAADAGTEKSGSHSSNLP